MNYEVNDISYNWHESLTFKAKNNPYNFLTVEELKTGCGIAQVYGIAGMTKENYDEYATILHNACAYYKEDGVGCFIATLGEDYYDKESMLLKLGFNEVSEYSNYRHDGNGNYKQKLFSLQL